MINWGVAKWILLLNDMRSSNIEILVPVARAENRSDLEALLTREKVTPYRTDDRWCKSFRQGGPLEWFNAPFSFDDGQTFVNVGTREDWMIRAGEDWDRKVMSIPTTL